MRRAPQAVTGCRPLRLASGAAEVCWLPPRLRSSPTGPRTGCPPVGVRRFTLASALVPSKGLGVGALGGPQSASRRWDPEMGALPASCTVHLGSDLPLASISAWIVGFLHHHDGRSQCQANYSTVKGDMPRRPSDYELSLGKITDCLRSDYPAFFERTPNFEIYDERVVFELGWPFHGVSALHGKRSYCRALSALHHLGCSTVRNGTVRCHIADGSSYGHALRVPWTCCGNVVWSQCPVHISAVSLYSIAAQVPELDSSTQLSHRISRHCVEFVEIHPPSLRSLLLRSWWQRQSGVEPVLALKQLREPVYGAAPGTEILNGVSA